MPLKSRWTVDIPTTSLPSWLFSSPNVDWSDKPAFLDANRPETHYFSLRTFRLWSQRLAAGLRAAGLRPGDRVLLFAGNGLFFPVVFMGVIMAGGIFTSASSSFMTHELTHQLRDADAKFLLATDASLETAIEAAEIAGMGKGSVFVYNDAPYDGHGEGKLGIRHWSHLIASEEVGREFQWKELKTREDADTTAVLNYSSGTTGLPKGVEITHYNLIANAIQIQFFSLLDPDDAENIHTARWLCFLPLHHAMGQMLYITVGPYRGVPIYIMPKFDFIKMLENLDRFKITELIVVPPIVVALAKHPLVRSGKYNLSSVRAVYSGAAPLGRGISEELESLWEKGKINVKQSWGMTECASPFFFFSPLVLERC
jgi:4-coumarate--CoA ligase